MLFANTVFLSKEEMLALSDLAGEKSMQDLMRNILQNYITTNYSASFPINTTNAWLCDYCLGLTADQKENCAICGTPRCQ